MDKFKLSSIVIFLGLLFSIQILPYSIPGYAAPNFEKTFTAESPSQIFAIGSQSLFRINVDEGWRPRIMTAHRGVEYYGGPRWAVIYEYDGEKKTLGFTKSGDSKIIVHPEYFVSTLSDSKLSVSHKLFPQGFTLKDTATLLNKSDKPIRVSHHQIWDLYMHRVVTPYALTFFRPIPGLEDAHSFFDRWPMREKSSIIKNENSPVGVHIERSYFLKPARNQLNPKNYFPADVNVMFSEVDDIYDVMKKWANPGSDGYLQKESIASLLGEGELTGPIWAGRKDFVLKPGESKNLESILVLEVGGDTVFDAEALTRIASKTDDILFSDNPYLDPSRWTTLQNEIQLKAEQMKVLTTWDEASNKLIVSQGSYYLENLGLHTSLRDFINAAVGLAVTLPEIAKSTLEYCMGLQDAKSSYLPYSWKGVMYIQKEPEVRSDLGVTLIWGLNEYLKSNPDWRWFFKADIPYYPATSKDLPPGAKGRSPFEHVKAAFYHLRDEVKNGKQGLPHCKSGDWSDALLSLAGKSGIINSTKDGESPMLGQMAFHVLNDLLTLLEFAPDQLKPIDTSRFIVDVKKYIDDVKIALQALYAKNKAEGYPFFPRAILFDGLHREKKVLSKNIDLAGQVWGLMVSYDRNNNPLEILNPEERSDVIERLFETNLTRIGFSTLNMPEGGDAAYFQLQTRPWSVINQWFTKALADNSKLREAWEQLWRTSLANHNRIFAQQNSDGSPRNELISGFDGWNPLNGKAWVLPFLPMDEARWNNVNHPAMFLWSASYLKEKTLKLDPWRKVRNSF